MELVIVLRKKVEDQQQGQTIFELVKQRMEDHPEVKVAGHITNHFDLAEGPDSG